MSDLIYFNNYLVMEIIATPLKVQCLLDFLERNFY